MSNLIYENKVREDVFNRSLDDQVAPELSDVIVKNAPSIYLDSREFFSSTYITDSMKSLVREITNALTLGKGLSMTLYSLFGGGKTHTVLLLFHAFNNPTVAREFGLEVPENIKVIGIGGKDSRTAPSPEDPIEEDGIKIKTLWGYIAKRLGKYDIVRKYDEDLMSPTKDKLEELFKGERVLILVDEIAAYLVRLKGLSGGNYYNQCLYFFENLASLGSNLPVVLLVTIPAKIEEKSKGDIRMYFEKGYEDVIEALSKKIERGGKIFRAPIETSIDLANVLIKRIFREINEDVKKRVVEEYQKYVDQFKDYLDVTTAREVVNTYPFHPLYVNFLKNLLEGNAHLQGSREAIKITRYVIRNLWENKPTRSLILPSDISIKDSQIRTILLKDFKSYDVVADTIIQRSKGLDVIFLLANYIFISTYYYQLGLDPSQLISALPDSKEIITSLLDSEYLSSSRKLPGDIKESLDNITSNSKNVDMIIPYLITDKGKYWVTWFLDPKTICEKDASKVSEFDADTKLDSMMLSLAEIPLDVIQKKGKKAISGMLLKLYRSIIRNIDEPIDIDEPSYYLVIIGRPICEDCKTSDDALKKAEEITRKLIYYTSSGKSEKPRRYANTLTLLFPLIGNNRDKIRDYVRRYISCSNIDVTPYYRDRVSKDYAQKILNDYVFSLESAIYNQIFQYFDRVAYPTGNNDVRIVELKSSGKTLLQQAEDTLLDEDKIVREDNFDFETLKAYLEATNVTIVDRMSSIKDIKEMFYANPSLPFITETTFYNAIRNGVEKLEIGIMNGGKVYYKKYEGSGEIIVNDSSIILPAKDAAEKEIDNLISQEKIIESENKIIKRYYILELPDGIKIPLRELRNDVDWLEKFKSGEIKLVEDAVEAGIDLSAEPSEIEGTQGETKEVKIIVKKIGKFDSKVSLSSSLGDLNVKEEYPDFQSTLKITVNQDSIVNITAKYDDKEKRISIPIRILQNECEKFVDQISLDSHISEINIINTEDLKNTLSKINFSIIGKKLLEGEVNIEDSSKKISLIMKPMGSNINDFISFLTPQLSLVGLKPKITGSLVIRVVEFKEINKDGIKNINELINKNFIKVKVKVC